MSLAAALASRSGALKHVEGSDSSLKSPQIVLCENSEDYARLMQETYIEEYLDSISGSTFASVLVELTPMVAGCLLEAGAQFQRAEDEWMSASIEDQDAEYDRALTVAREVAQLADVAARLDAGLRELGQTRAFIRMSSRSPKDAALRVKGFNALVCEENDRIVAEMQANGVDVSSETGQRVTGMNARLWALYRASTQKMCVSSGEQAVALLLLSARIRDDLEGIAARKPDSDAPPFNFVLREWMDIDVQYEFRGFVYKGVFTALTQYNEFVFFPALAREKDVVLSAVRSWMDSHTSSIKLASYVLDLALKPNGTGNFEFTIYIVELNPFAEFAGGGLFTWTKDMDVLTGKLPFEFRICTAPREFAEKEIPPSWSRYLQDDEDGHSVQSRDSRPKI